ncbi:MAG TPA: EamA family transporter [Jiangellales bacterium]|nr:EamA family transporter [Jiangellales bacterium]
MRHATHPARGYALVLGAAMLFSVNASVSKVVLEAGVPPDRLTALRCTGAAIGLLVVALLAGPRRLRLTWRELPGLVVLGIVGAALIQWFYFVAIDRLPVGVALLLEFTAPVFVALYARVVQRAAVRRRVWLAIALSLAGLGLVAEVWRDAGLDGLGVAAGLAAALCLTTYYVVGAQTVARRDPVSLTFWMFAFAAMFWAVVLPWSGFDWGTLTGATSMLGALDTVEVPVWWPLAFVVVGGTLVPFALNLGALAHLPATQVGVVGMSEPVLAGLVAWLWLGQSLSTVQLVGGAVVLVGIGLAQTARVQPADEVEPDWSPPLGDELVVGAEHAPGARPPAPRRS